MYPYSNKMIMAKKNIYTHSIDLKKLQVKNCDPDSFRQKLENLPYRGYEVEKLKDGRKIVITKPGGKRTFGKIKREDIMVWVYRREDNTLWLISHGNIYEDIEEKGKVNPSEAIKIIDALEEVCNGAEPDEILNERKLTNPTGEDPEVLLKAYKWIWGQEDCKYPDGEGRMMSMKSLLKLRSEINKNLK